MNMFNGFNTSASALTANRLRMDVVSSNIANAETTRSEFVDGEWQPYKRKVVQLQENSFESQLQKAMGTQDSSSEGVKVESIREDQEPFKLVYNPTHPDANEEGYVEMPNIDIVKEMVDMMSASRSYEANVTALNATKSMYMKALELGR